MKSVMKIAMGSFGVAKGGPPEKTTLGSRPLNFHATYRVELRQSKARESDGSIVGDVVTMYTTKNKLAPKFREIVVPS